LAGFSGLGEESAESAGSELVMLGGVRDEQPEPGCLCVREVQGHLVGGNQGEQDFGGWCSGPGV
jgi:hypothetical protein